MRAESQPSEHRHGGPESSLESLVPKGEDQATIPAEISFSKITLRFPEEVEAEYRNALGEHDYQAFWDLACSVIEVIIWGITVFFLARGGQILNASICVISMAIASLPSVAFFVAPPRYPAWRERLWIGIRICNAAANFLVEVPINLARARGMRILSAISTLCTQLGTLPFIQPVHFVTHAAMLPPLVSKAMLFNVMACRMYVLEPADPRLEAAFHTADYIFGALPKRTTPGATAVSDGDMCLRWACWSQLMIVAVSTAMLYVVERRSRIAFMRRKRATAAPGLPDMHLCALALAVLPAASLCWRILELLSWHGLISN